MANLVVSIADLKVSRDPETTILTYALGSCIALALYDPAARLGGLLHYMLPSSQNDAHNTARNPAMYADTGIPLLLQELQRMGAHPKKLVAHLAGGGQILESHGVFNIGKRNHIAAKNILWKHGILVRSESVGGNFTRSFGLSLATGQIWLKQQDTSTPTGEQAHGENSKGERHGLSSARS
jgi:chemotaxis protein CheD